MSVAKKKTPAPKSAPAARAPAPTKSAPSTKGQTITLLINENPKTGASAARFGFYRDGMSVENYVAKVVKTGASASTARADIRWDSERKYISVG